MRFADDDRGLKLVAEMAVDDARHRAIARHVDQRRRGGGVERHDLVVADDAVVDALRRQRLDIGGAGQPDRFRAVGALFQRKAQPDAVLLDA